mgnify:CR=1 FL=1
MIYGEGTRVGSGFCSAAGARQYIQHGCAIFLAFVVDTQVWDQVSISDVPVVREFVDVCPEEFSGVHSERQVEIKINLGPGAAPIAKAPYILAPPEM